MRIFNDVGLVRWRAGMGACFVLTRAPMVSTSCVLSHGVLDAAAYIAIFVAREQPS